MNQRGQQQHLGAPQQPNMTRAQQVLQQAQQNGTLQMANTKYRDPSEVYQNAVSSVNFQQVAQGKTPRQTTPQDAQLRAQQQLLTQRVQQAAQLPQMYAKFDNTPSASNKSSFNRPSDVSKGPITRQIHLKQLEKAQREQQQQMISENPMNTDRNYQDSKTNEDMKMNNFHKQRNSLGGNADNRYQAPLVNEHGRYLMSGEEDEETAVNFASDRNHYTPQHAVSVPAGPRSGVIQNQYVQQHKPVHSSETEEDDEVEREGLTAAGSVKAMESENLTDPKGQSKIQQKNYQDAQKRYNNEAVNEVYGRDKHLRNMNVAQAARDRNSHRQDNSWTRQAAPQNHKRAASDNMYRTTNNYSSSGVKDSNQRQYNASPISSSKLTATQRVLRKGLGTDSNRDISPFTKAARAQEEHFKRQSEIIQKRSQQTYAQSSYNTAQNYRIEKNNSSTRLKKSSSKGKSISKQSLQSNFEYSQTSTAVRGQKRAGIFSYEVIDEEQSNEAKESMVSKGNTDPRRMQTYMSNNAQEQVEQVVAAAKNVISIDYGNDKSESMTSDIVEQDDEFEIPQSPERAKQNNLRQINDNMAMNRGTIKKSDSKSFTNQGGFGITVSSMMGTEMSVKPNRQVQSFMSKDSRQHIYQTINAAGPSSVNGQSRSFIGFNSQQQSKADLSQQTNTATSRMADKFRTNAPTEQTSYKRIVTHDTQGSIDDEPKPRPFLGRNDGPSDSSSVRTLMSYQANNGAVIGSHPPSTSSKRIQQPYARPIKDQLSPNGSQQKLLQDSSRYQSNVAQADLYSKMIGTSKRSFKDSERAFNSQQVDDWTPSDKVYHPRNSPKHDKTQQSRHEGESNEPLSAFDNRSIVSQNAVNPRNHLSLATASAKIGTMSPSAFGQSEQSPQFSPQMRVDAAAGKGTSLITVTKIPNQVQIDPRASVEGRDAARPRTSVVAVTPQLKNLDDVNRRQSKLQRVLALNAAVGGSESGHKYDALTPKQVTGQSLKPEISPPQMPSTTRHGSNERLDGGLQVASSPDWRYGGAQETDYNRPRVNASQVGPDSNRIQINLYDFNTEQQQNSGSMNKDRSQGALQVPRTASQTSVGERVPLQTKESSNTADIEAKIEQFGLEQFRLGQMKLEQELRNKESKIQQDYDKKLQVLQQQIQKEQDEKQKLAEEAERRALEQAEAIKESLRRELEAEMREQMRRLDEQHQRENETLKEQIAAMKGNYLDMQTNLLRNEQIRKVQQQQIIHLKGNMRVFARVKPSNTFALEMQQAIGEDESAALGGVNIFDHSQFEPQLVTFPQLMEDAEGKVVKVAHQSLELHMPRVGGGTQAAQVFNFDHVFLPNSGQAELFEEIKPFVQTALDGENTCIFAYGQTGSGKTFTMEGPSTDGGDGPPLFDQASMRPYTYSGILPRIAIFIQHEIDRYRRQFHQEIFIEVSALEIYCDHIRDLLGQPSDPSKQRYVEIRSAGNNKVQCLGQTWVRVSSPAEFLHQINESAKKRVFRDNGINPHSSRSHHVFQIRVNSYDKLGKPCQSMLNVVDLAGSERRVGALNVFHNQHDDDYYSTNAASRTKKKRGSKAPNKKDNPSSVQRFNLDNKRPSGMSVQSAMTVPSQSLTSTQPRAQQPSILQDQQGSREPQSFNSKFASSNPSSLAKTDKQKRASVFTTHKKSFMSGAGQATAQKPPASSSRQLQLQGPENLRHSVSQQTLGLPVTATTTANLLEQVPKTYDLETESKFINKNLTTLGRVLAILANRKLQGKMAPPYRECKLTRLLQSSLQHDKCKTLMIVNVCSSMKNATATKESLEFASKAMTAF